MVSKIKESIILATADEPSARTIKFFPLVFLRKNSKKEIFKSEEVRKAKREPKIILGVNPRILVKSGCSSQPGNDGNKIASQKTKAAKTLRKNAE